MSKASDLRNALYRARATMAEASRIAAEVGGTSNTSNLVLGFQRIDRLMQDGVEDADRALIEYEQISILQLWYCDQCHAYQFPDGSEDEDGPPECNHGMFFEDPSLGASASEMRKVTVERID